MGLILFLVISFFAGYIASRKGGSSGGYAIGAMFLGGVLGVSAIVLTQGNGDAAAFWFVAGPIVVLIGAFFLRSPAALAASGHRVDGYRTCPYCAEAIREEAVKCKHCGSDVSETSHPAVD